MYFDLMATLLGINHQTGGLNFYSVNDTKKVHLQKPISHFLFLIFDSHLKIILILILVNLLY